MASKQYTPVFGPDPDLSDAERKCAEMNGERARNDEGHYIADDPSTPDVNEAYVGGKAPTKPKKTAAKKKTPAKKAVAKKPAAKKATKKK
jgi:topoisomerase IA-like protein